MRKIWLIFSQAVTVSVAVVFVLSALKPNWLAGLSAHGEESATIVLAAKPTARAASTAARHEGYSAAAKLAGPAVVSIKASKMVAQNQRRQDPWFRFFFGEPGSPVQAGIGSGVIVAHEGYILTNNHVIDRMDDIEVWLSDGRRAKAKLIGADPETDIAVLKIDLDRLPAITFGDSEALEVGDVVLAIGNPFGVGQTVTSGIVSALGRNQLGINTFENFIQTDAAINPGNSGGALVDTDGNLMGINSAIYSRSGGSLGIGFAIPATSARQVMESLIRDGQVTRGWIGVEPRELSAELAESFNLSSDQGVLITAVLDNGPAGRAGMRPGDVITAIEGAPVNSTAELLNRVAALKPGSEAVIQVARGARQLTLKIRVALRPRSQMAEHDLEQ